MKIKKFVVALIMFLAVISLCPKPVQANGFSFPSFSELMQDGKNFLSKGKNNNVSESQLQSVFLPMARILLSIGIIVLVGVTMVMGIKYMFASPEESAKLKQQLIGLVVSALVIFGAVGIWSLAYQVLSSVL